MGQHSTLKQKQLLRAFFFLIQKFEYEEQKVLESFVFMSAIYTASLKPTRILHNETPVECVDISQDSWLQLWGVTV